MSKEIGQNTFFGGKMFHCFENSNGFSDGDDAQLYIKKLKEGALEALSKGNWFVKIDGSNGLLIFNEESKQYDLYRRYDDKKDKFKGEVQPGYINLPPGKNPDVYESASASHKYYQQFIPRPSLDTKGKEPAMWRELYSQIDKAQAMGKLVNKSYSIELVGKNFSGTPGVPTIGIALHCDQVMEKPPLLPNTEEEWYLYFYELFEKMCAEGIIVEYQGLYWKIRADLFRKDSAWRLGKELAIPPNLI